MCGLGSLSPLNTPLAPRLRSLDSLTMSINNSLSLSHSLSPSLSFSLLLFLSFSRSQARFGNRRRSGGVPRRSAASPQGSKVSLSLTHTPSLSLTHTHTHTHTHTYTHTLSLSLSHTHRHTHTHTPLTFDPGSKVLAPHSGRGVMPTAVSVQRTPGVGQRTCCNSFEFLDPRP